MKRIALLLLAVSLYAAPSHAGFIDTAKTTGSTFLSQVHGQVGFGTHDLRATPHENSNGFYFARFEAPLYFQNLIISLEPRRNAGEDADHDIDWAGDIAFRIF